MMDRPEKNKDAPAISFETLPDEMILLILSSLGYKEWTTLACVSSRMRNIARDNSLWRRYFSPANLRPRDLPPRGDELFYLKAATDYRHGLISTFFGLLRAVKTDGTALYFGFRNNLEIVLAAVSQNGSALRYASEELRADRETVLVAVRNCGSALRYASEELRADPAIVLAAVSQNGCALRYASAELKADREIVLAAVSQEGMALFYASDALRDNPETVLAAVSQDGMALEYASEEWRDDPAIVLAAVSQDSSALQFARNTVFACASLRFLAHSCWRGDKQPLTSSHSPNACTLALLSPIMLDLA